jgi:2-dehydro-3-deoxyphosphogluconate aldolase/(4S)-4-hydroxy-2-oxoglutarate aldolase
MHPIEQRAMTSELIKKIDDAGIIFVLIIDDVKHIYKNNKTSKCAIY